MIERKPIDGEMNEAEMEKTGGTPKTGDMPEAFRFLDEQEHGLRQRYADWIIWLLATQFLVADAVFVVFAWAGRRWDLPPGVIEVWLAATVVQVVGVVAIVARHLFPGREVSA